jgi:hypothetical protein
VGGGVDQHLAADRQADGPDPRAVDVWPRAKVRGRSKEVALATPAEERKPLG